MQQRRDEVDDVDECCNLCLDYTMYSKYYPICSRFHDDLHAVLQAVHKFNTPFEHNAQDVHVQNSCKINTWSGSTLCASCLKHVHPVNSVVKSWNYKIFRVIPKLSLFISLVAKFKKILCKESVCQNIQNCVICFFWQFKLTCTW